MSRRVQGPESSGGAARSFEPSMLLVALLILIAALSGGYQAMRRGADQLVWDECEYLGGALQSADNLEVNGLSSWPQEVALRQKFVKPPLLVNTLVPGVMVFGRDRVERALGVFAAFAIATALGVVALLVWRLASPDVAWRSVLAVGAMPVVGYYGWGIYPEILLVSLTLGVVVILPWRQERLVWWRAVALGLVLALGVLGKTTYPALVVGPVLVWIGTVRKRVEPLRWGGFLVGAAVIAFGMARVWYATNFGRAWNYATGAYGWSSWVPESQHQVLVALFRGIVADGIGVLVSSVLAVVVVLWLVDAARKRSGEMGSLAGALALVFAAVPLIAVAVSSPNVNQRLIMPALVCLVVAGMVGPWPVIGKKSRWLAPAATVVLLVQFAAVQLGWLVLPPPGQATSIPKSMMTLNPFLSDLTHPRDSRPVEAVFEALEELQASGSRADCWLLSDYREFNQNLLGLHRHLRRYPGEFRWGSYFSWPRDRIRSRIDELKRTSSILAWYEPRRAREKGPGYLNRHSRFARDLVREPTRGFELWRRLAPADGAFVLELYRNFGSFGETAQFEAFEVNAEFGGAIRLEKVELGHGRIVVTCTCVGRLGRDYQLMLHSTDVRQPDAGFVSWDRPISPKTSTWQVGQQYVLSHRLPKALPDVRYRLEIAFFEVVVPGQRWRRLPRSDQPGADSIILTASPVRLGSSKPGGD